MKKQLLFLSTFGTYPGFDDVFNKYQYQVTKTKTLRKALSSLKNIKPDVIIAEFIYSPTYGSQLSNFESLFACAQTTVPDARFIALVHKDDIQHLKKLADRFNNYLMLTFPVNKQQLMECLNSIETTVRQN